MAVASSSVIAVPGAELACREAGEGPLALFVHGFPLDHTLWLDQLGALADLRRCAAIDLRGFGASTPITGPSLEMETLADDLAAAVEALGGEQADVVALSMGGYAALALWERHPEVVRSLVLMDTKAEADTDQGMRRRDETVAAVLERGRSWLAGEMVVALLAPEAPVEARARLRSMVEGCRYETITAALRGMRDRLDRRFLLHSISVPTLVVVGDRDELMPPEAARAMAAEIPGARLVPVEGAGHLPPIERPDEVAALLRGFWAN